MLQTKTLNEYDMSQSRKSYTGDQEHFMEAVSSNGYGGVCHPNFHNNLRIQTPSSLTERDTVKISERVGRQQYCAFQILCLRAIVHESLYHSILCKVCALTVQITFKDL